MFTTDANESMNSLARGRILNFLNISLHEALLLVTVVILMVFFGMENTLLCCVPQKIIPYGMTEWK